MTSENEILMAVLQRAASDLAFRQALKANPGQVLAEAGLQMPEGMRYEVLENSADCIHIVLPPLAEEEELGGEALEARATKTMAMCWPGPGGAVTMMPVCQAS
jgi:hypothetical protein